MVWMESLSHSFCLCPLLWGYQLICSRHCLREMASAGHHNSSNSIADWHCESAPPITQSIFLIFNLPQLHHQAAYAHTQWWKPSVRYIASSVGMFDRIGLVRKPRWFNWAVPWVRCCSWLPCFCHNGTSHIKSIGLREPAILLKTGSCLVC